MMLALLMPMLSGASAGLDDHGAKAAASPMCQPPRALPDWPTFHLLDNYTAGKLQGLDAADPYMWTWLKTQPGPVIFDGPPCAFSGRFCSALTVRVR